MDPLRFGGLDANQYRYVGNFSTGATDPTGTLQAVEFVLNLGSSIARGVARHAFNVGIPVFLAEAGGVYLFLHQFIDIYNDLAQASGEQQLPELPDVVTDVLPEVRDAARRQFERLEEDMSRM